MSAANSFMDKEYKNNVRIRRTVMSVMAERGKTTVRLATSIGNERFVGRNKDVEVTSFYPEVVFYTSNIGEKLEAGRAHVDIIAHVHTWYNNTTERNVREIVGDNITKSERLLAEYSSDISGEANSFNRPDDENIVTLDGVVHKIDIRSDNFGLLTIAVKDKRNPEHTDMCYVTCRGSFFVSKLKKAKKDDWAAFAGQIVTSFDEERRYRWMILCRDLEIESKEEDA